MMIEKLKKFTKISNYKILALCILVIIGVIYYYEDLREIEIEIPKNDVVVFKEDVTENTIIKEDMLILEQRYAEDIMKEKNIATAFDEVIGMRTKVPIYKGEAINKERLILNDNNTNSGTLKTDVPFQVNDTDRALNLKKGDYIDIWIEPIDIKSGLIPEKLFSKIPVKEAVNTHKEAIDKNKEYEDIDGKIASYVILSLSDIQIDKLYSVDKTLSNIRIARYSETDFYNIVNQQGR